MPVTDAALKANRLPWRLNVLGGLPNAIEARTQWTRLRILWFPVDTMQCQAHCCPERTALRGQPALRRGWPRSLIGIHPRALLGEHGSIVRTPGGEYRVWPARNYLYWRGEGGARTGSRQRKKTGALHSTGQQARSRWSTPRDTYIIRRRHVCERIVVPELLPQEPLKSSGVREGPKRVRRGGERWRPRPLPSIQLGR